MRWAHGVIADGAVGVALVLDVGHDRATLCIIVGKRYVGPCVIGSVELYNTQPDAGYDSKHTHKWVVSFVNSANSED